MSRHDPTSVDHLVGTLLADRYRVIRRIGAGSMGVVFEVEHELIGRRLALKTLHADLSEDVNVLTRFQREARAAGSIGHQHIIEITDMGVLPEGSPFIVLELLDGHDLGQEIRTFGALSIPRAADIAIQCCRALHAAHEKGIVHRDLKPDNIFLVKGRDRPDFVKLLDFGVSKFLEAAARLDGHATTRTGRTVGTPYYMSPEQCQGSRDVDRRADVYAMGVVIFEMLTGRRPFSAPHFPALAIKIMQDPRPSILADRPACPPELDAVVKQAMAAKAADRFATAAALADALVPFADPQEPRSTPPEHKDGTGDDTETFVSPLTFDAETGSPAEAPRAASPVRPKAASDAPAPVARAVVSVEPARLPELSMSRTEADAPSLHRVELAEDRVVSVSPLESGKATAARDASPAEGGASGDDDAPDGGGGEAEAEPPATEQARPAGGTGGKDAGTEAARVETAADEGVARKKAASETSDTERTPAVVEPEPASAPEAKPAADETAGGAPEPAAASPAAPHGDRSTSVIIWVAVGAVALVVFLVTLYGPRC